MEKFDFFESENELTYELNGGLQKTIMSAVFLSKPSLVDVGVSAFVAVAIIVAIIISQILFALFHIPYGFAIGSLLLHVGFGSVVLPFVYVKSKNLVLCYLIFTSKFMGLYVIRLLGM